MVLVRYSVRGGAMKAPNVQVVPFAPTRISVKDFGPIREADVHLGKVTVLMGPDNVGKSYFTVLMPVLEELIRNWRYAQALMSPTNYTFTLKDFELQLNVMLYDILHIFYSIEPEELIRRGAEKAEIEFELRYSEGQAVVLEVQIDKVVLEVQIDKSGVNTKLHGFDELFESSKAPTIEPVVYIPAERAGIMRTLKQLLRLSLATSAPLHRRKVQLMGERIRLPGVSVFFLEQLLGVEKFTEKERKRAFTAPALELLEEVLRGRIEMYEDLSVRYYPIGAGKPIKLINASAMVSELSAIYILSGAIKEGWWMVVEEPEAHVHPKGQIGIARFMAKLARLGVNVMATTHSDHIALKLAQMVGLAGLSPEERERLGYRGDEYLTKGELALYFKEPTGDGSVARKVEVSETGEVSELPTYSNVLEEMYREAVRLLELHGKIPKVMKDEGH
jgi:predicted ATPase